MYADYMINDSVGHIYADYMACDSVILDTKMVWNGTSPARFVKLAISAVSDVRHEKI